MQRGCIPARTNLVAFTSDVRVIENFAHDLTVGNRPIVNSQARSTKHFVRGTNTSRLVFERLRSTPRGCEQQVPGTSL